MKETSQLIDKGIIIPGINDSFYNDAPDIGCFENTEVVSILSKKNKDLLKTLFCYPNPCKETLIFKISNLFTSDDLNQETPVILQVFNLRGRVVYKQKIGASINTIVWHTQKANAGKYIARIAGNGKEYRREIIVLK